MQHTRHPMRGLVIGASVGVALTTNELQATILLTSWRGTYRFELLDRQNARQNWLTQDPRESENSSRGPAYWLYENERAG